MKKLFTLAAAVIASMAMNADVIFGPFTLTADNNVKDQVTAVDGGSVTVTTAFATGGSNEVTVNEQTFYKFNSSSAITCALADAATFEEGDSIVILTASHASSKKTTGVKLNNSIEVTGEIPGGEATEVYYIVQAEDGISGTNSFTVNRYNSDSKFGTITVYRPGEVIPSTDPVASVTVDGPANGAIGFEATFTANTDVKADAYKWYVDGAEQEGATAKTFAFTPTAERTYRIMAAAKNEYNADFVQSAGVDFVVTKLCGELIKAEHVNKNTATVTGIVGGTADKNTQDNGKLGSNGHYFGVKLASGSFMAGDVVTIVASALNGGNTATIYSDKGENLLGSVDFDAETLTAVYTLTTSADAIYVYRASSACNPSIASISVNRSCEASNNAELAKLTVNGVEVEPEEGGLLYVYTLSASYTEPTVTIALTLAHPLATIKYDLSNPYEMETPEAGSNRGQAFTIVAEDGTEKTYTVRIYKSNTLNDDWTLSSLSVDGFELSPAFENPYVVMYTITKPYGTPDPELSALHYTLNDPNATAEASMPDGQHQYLIACTAENGTSTNNYVIDIIEAPAKKDLLEVSFSNGVNGYIAAGEINVPYLAGKTEPSFVEAKFWNADGEPSAEIVEGKLVVTGADSQTAEYTINYIPVTPMAVDNQEVTFDAVPSYIYSVYGWDASKGVKFSKDVEEAGNHRISEGKDRIYIALPGAREVILTSGSGGKRPIKVTVNGVVDESITQTAASGESITIALSEAVEGNFIGIESNGNNGDGGFTNIKVNGWPTGIDNTDASVKATKRVINGVLFIEKNGVLYDAQGAIVK